MSSSPLPSTSSPFPAECIVCSAKEARHCTRCRIASYCSPACQRKDYADHRPFCVYAAKMRDMYPDNPLCHDACFIVVMYSVQSVALSMLATRTARRRNLERLTGLMNAVDDKAHDAVKAEAVRAMASYEEHGKEISTEVERQASRLLTLVRVFYENSPHARNTPLDMLNAMFVASTREVDEHVHVMLVAVVPPPLPPPSAPKDVPAFQPVLFGEPRTFSCSAILTASTRGLVERLRRIPGLDGLENKAMLDLNQERLHSQTGFLVRADPSALPPLDTKADAHVPVPRTRRLTGISIGPDTLRVVAEDKDAKTPNPPPPPSSPPPPPPYVPAPAYTERTELPSGMDAKALVGIPVRRAHGGEPVGRVADAITHADGRTTVVIDPPLTKQE